MKRMGNLYENFLSNENLYKCYKEVKEYLEYCKEQIIKFLKKEDLVLNNKTAIYSNKKNFIFIGRNQKGQYSKRRTARRRLKEKRYFYFKGKINNDEKRRAYYKYWQPK